jgi:hypothetical protein
LYTSDDDDKPKIIDKTKSVAMRTTSGKITGAKNKTVEKFKRSQFVDRVTESGMRQRD